MWEQIRELCGSSDPAVQSRAQMAMDISISYQQNEINESQYQELLADLIRLDTLDSECSDLEAKTMLVTAINACSKLV